MSNEIKGVGNSYTAEFWEYDPRLGRRWNVDPIVKYHESPYATFHNNPILLNDPNGDDPPKKPGFWTRLFRGANNDFYMTRAEEYANDNKIDEGNIIKLEHSWVVVNNNDEENVRYSVFRKSNPNRYTALSTSPLNDDVNLSYQQFLETNVNGEEIFNAGLPQTSAISATSNMIQMGSKSKTSLVGIFGKVSKTLTAYGKQIRFGVTGHPDVLKKGVHLHFDEVVAKMELGLRPTQNGGIGLVQVGKLVGTADDIKRAVTLFNQAMNSAKFRTELLTRIKSAQEYSQHAFRFTKDSKLAIDKAHEFNYLIKALEKL